MSVIAMSKGPRSRSLGTKVIKPVFRAFLDRFT